LKFGSAPIHVIAKMRVANVLAAANDGFRLGKVPEFRAQPESSVEPFGEKPQLFSFAEQNARLRQPPCDSKPCDLALDER
jgi:hypothetical protein